VQVNLAPRLTLRAHEYLESWTGPHKGDAPDLVVVNSSWLPQFSGSFVPLDDLRASSAAGKILPPVLSLLTVQGHLMAVPWCLGARVLLVRSDLITEKHLPLPEDWAKLAFLTAPGLNRPPDQWGIGLPGARSGGGAILLQEMFWAEGDALIGPHGGVDLTTPGKVRALDRYCKLAQFAEPEIMTWPQTELENAFVQGHLGLLVSDTWVARAWQSYKNAPKYEVLPLPHGDTPVADLLGDGLAVFASSPEKAEALAFAQMLLTSTAQRKLVAWGGIPVHADLLAEMAHDPLLEAVLPTLAAAQGGAADAPAAAMQALENAIYLAVSGRQTPAEALRVEQQWLGASASAVPGGPPG
jgi:ABC-type glycerol-3-phosphate transport system substrate-binding protein